jgi:hypothetical protein
MTHQTDAALLVELTVTKRRKQFIDVLQCLRSRGWNIVNTPRDGEFGLSADSSADVPDVEGARR